MVKAAGESFVGEEEVLGGGDGGVVVGYGVDEGGEGGFDAVELSLDDGVHGLRNALWGVVEVVFSQDTTRNKQDICKVLKRHVQSFLA